MELIKGYVVEIIAAVLIAGGTITTQIVRRHIKTRKIRRILSLKKGASGIFIPVKNLKFQAYPESVHNNPCVYRDDLILYKEVRILYEVKKLIDRLGKDLRLEVHKDRNTFHTQDNAFYFGGYIAHEYVRDVLCGKFAHVKFTCTEEVYNKWKDEKIKKILEISKDVNIRHIKVNGKVMFECNSSKDESLAVFIKRTGKADFGSSEYGTEHICFGKDADASLSLAKCFNEYSDTLYKYVRKHKGHYFIVAKCDKEKQRKKDAIFMEKLHDAEEIPTVIYCDTDDFCKGFEEYWNKHLITDGRPIIP